MRIVVLTSPESWYFRDLQRAAGDGIQIEAVPFTRLTSMVDVRATEVASVGRILEAADAVLVRTMPPGSLEQVVFRMDALQQLYEQGTRVVNSPKAIEAAVDKYLALAKLRSAGLPVPRTEACQHVDDAMEIFRRFGSDVVVKPLFGSEGRGITRIQDEAIAHRTFKLLTELRAVIYQQEYLEHAGEDLRLLVVGSEVLAMRRFSDTDWRTNVSRGARTEPIHPTAELCEMAFRAARSVDAELAGVDFLVTTQGQTYVIEVNAVPGWRAMAGATGVDVAQRVLRVLGRAS